METASEPMMVAQGAWINSCLVGANSYRILSTSKEYEAAFLEENVDEITRTGDERRYARAVGSNDKSEVWIVLFQTSSNEMNKFADILEYVHSDIYSKKGFIWPIDLVWDNSLTVSDDDDKMGYVIPPIDRSRFFPIRQVLMKSDAPRWALSKSIFSRLKELYGYGLTLNGFSREQVRVDRETNEVWFCPNEHIVRIDEAAPYYERKSFLSVPRQTEKMLNDKGKRLSGIERDIFSAAVLSFYLLFYTHPFVGSEYNGLLRNQYLNHYNESPAYIFGSNEANAPGNLEFGREIQNQWKKTLPELKRLYNDLFQAMSNPEDKNRNDPSPDFLNVEKWLNCLEADAAINDNETSRSKYPFEAERLHRV